MKKIILYTLPLFIFASCVRDDDFCDCTPPPGPDEILIVSLKNENGDNLLLPDTFGYIAEDKLMFYLLTGENKIDLTKNQNNNTIIEEYVSNIDGSIIKNIALTFSWYMKNNKGTKEGNYVIDYNGLYPNDTIFTKYSVTEWKESDRLLEVKLNGVLQKTDSISEFRKGITIVK